MERSEVAERDMCKPGASWKTDQTHRSFLSNRDLLGSEVS